MKFTPGGTGSSGPSSSIGILRFFDADSGGPKMSPEFVLAAAFIFAIAVAAFQFFT